jgi:GNAT superfamily N-acetyltransferase
VTIRREPVTSKAARVLIAALNRELLGLYPEAGTEEHFRLDPEEVAEGRGAFLVAVRDDEPVACGAVRRFTAPEFAGAGIAEIKRMYVVPEARRDGLGACILARLEEEARALGARRIVLETGPRQLSAVALYREAGYVEIEAFGPYTTHPLSLFLGKELRDPD